MPGQSIKVCSLKAKSTAFNSASSVGCESESRGDREGDSFDVDHLLYYYFCVRFFSWSQLLVISFHDFKVALNSLSPARLILIPALVA